MQRHISAFDNLPAGVEEASINETERKTFESERSTLFAEGRVIKILF